MQQNLIQMQPMMAGVTTDIIQQYLDENKQLILAILDYQNTGKAAECAEIQAKLQRNLMYLAAIADNQSQVHTTSQQYPPNAAMQSDPRCMPYHQPLQIAPQSLMATRSSMLYAQPTLQQQAALHGQLATIPEGSNGFNMFHGDESRAGSSGGRQSGERIEPPLYLKGSGVEGN